MLKVSNLSIEYRKVLFENLSFSLGDKEKVGLIGLNGCGKTTLLKIIVGLEIPDKGKVELIQEKVAYLPQEYSFEKGVLVGEILEGLVSNPIDELYKVNKILNKLGLTNIDHYQEVHTLSYGQKMKLYLATLLIDEPTILLLDEPTNHLDVYGILWLEDFIKKFDGICIIISHDRAFLNNVINKIFEIDEGKLNIFEGNYDEYLLEKEKLIEKREIEFTLQERRRDKFVGMIARIKKGPGGEKQARALKAAKTRMEREVSRNEVNKYKETKIEDLSLKGQTHKDKQVVKVENVSFGYDQDKLILDKTNFAMYGKEKIWFYGTNGIGKSTLVKLIVGELEQSSGVVKIGNNLKWSYFSQDQSHLPMDETVEDYFLNNTPVSHNQSFGVLEKFLFSKDMRKIKLKKLSPGQRARISFAVFAQHEYDFLILDEPTNHLDIRSKEVIEEALREFKGAIFLISHDRYFVESIGIDRMVTIEDRKIVTK